MSLGSGRFFLGKKLFGRVVKSMSWNQENLGDLAQENVLTTGVIFSKTERRTVNKDKWFFSFTTAHLKPTLYLPTLPIKWCTVTSLSCISWYVFTHNTQRKYRISSAPYCSFPVRKWFFLPKGSFSKHPSLGDACLSMLTPRAQRREAGSYSIPSMAGTWHCDESTKASSRNQCLYCVLSKYKQRPSFSYKVFETIRSFPGEIELFREYVDRRAQNFSLGEGQAWQ